MLLYCCLCCWCFCCCWCCYTDHHMCVTTLLIPIFWLYWPPSKVKECEDSIVEVDNILGWKLSTTLSISNLHWKFGDIYFCATRIFRNWQQLHKILSLTTKISHQWILNLSMFLLCCKLYAFPCSWIHTKCAFCYITSVYLYVRVWIITCENRRILA